MFSLHANTFEQQANAILGSYQDKTQQGLIGVFISRVLPAFEDNAAQMAEMVRTDFRASLDLNGHPKFDKNQNAFAPGEDRLADEFVRTEYRRFYDQYATGRNAISQWKDRYADEILKIRRELDVGFAESAID